MTVAAGYAPTLYNLASIAAGGALLGPFATAWPYAFDSDVVVQLNLGEGAGFQVLASGAEYVLVDDAPTTTDGGAVTLSNALMAGAATWPAGSVLALTRMSSSDQPSAFGELNGFSPSASEQALDHAVRQIQEVADRISRVLSVPLGETGLTLPSAATRAGGVAVWDAEGNLTVTSTAEFQAQVALLVQSQQVVWG